MPHKHFLTAHPAPAEIRLTLSYVFLKETWLEVFDTPPLCSTKVTTLPDATSFCSRRFHAPVRRRSSLTSLMAASHPGSADRALSGKGRPAEGLHSPGRPARLRCELPCRHVPQRLFGPGPCCQRHLSWTRAFKFQTLYFYTAHENQR